MRGRVVRFGDDIDTDTIIPGRYLRTLDLEEMATHVLEPLGVDPENLKGRIIVAGKNFGCGSSREQAAMVLKEAGVAAIIAPTFARIFFRNAINIGLAVVECQDAGKIGEGDEVEVDTGKGIVMNATKGEEYGATRYPPIIADIIEKGGLLAYYRETHHD
jgi:3-isopropylmalate/(R)-2-methylmalate dehydratase small subunit